MSMQEISSKLKEMATEVAKAAAEETDNAKRCCLQELDYALMELHFTVQGMIVLWEDGG